MGIPMIAWGLTDYGWGVRVGSSGGLGNVRGWGVS